mgnify:CR=1 FL=1
MAPSAGARVSGPWAALSRIHPCNRLKSLQGTQLLRTDVPVSRSKGRALCPPAQCTHLLNAKLYQPRLARVPRRGGGRCRAGTGQSVFCDTGRQDLMSVRIRDMKRRTPDGRHISSTGGVTSCCFPTWKRTFSHRGLLTKSREFSSTSSGWLFVSLRWANTTERKHSL